MTIPQIRTRPDGRREVVCLRPGCGTEPVVTPFLEVARTAAKKHVCLIARPAPDATGGDAA